MATVKNPRTQNKPSKLLTKEENELVFSLLGEKCNTLATAVVQLLVTTPPAHSKWTKLVTGVTCFVRDPIKRSYFIKVFDIEQRKRCVWEQEFYRSFECKSPRNNFLTFEASDCRAGLHFADETEANDFLNSCKARRQILENKATQNNAYNKNRSNLHPAPKGPLNMIQNIDAHDNQATNGSKKLNKGQKIDIKTISGPTDFRHVQHIGWNSASGYEVSQTFLQIWIMLISLYSFYFFSLLLPVRSISVSLK